MTQSPTPDTRWPILQPGAGYIDLLDTPAGPVIATATVSATGWRIRSTNPTRTVNAHSSTRAGAMAVLASLAGHVPCHCGHPLIWRFRPGRHGTWIHERPPADDDCPRRPADDTWWTL